MFSDSPCAAFSAQKDITSRPDGFVYGTERQKWMFAKKGRHERNSKISGTLSDPEWTRCLDNMQKKEGAPEMYGCHGMGTQRWEWTDEGKIRVARNSVVESDGTCIGFKLSVSLGLCQPGDDSSTWDLDGRFLKPRNAHSHCLERLGSGVAGLRPCRGDPAYEPQTWLFDVVDFSQREQEKNWVCLWGLVWAVCPRKLVWSEPGNGRP